MSIMTISREFGSGGRELGKRIADLLKFDYYDKEIVKSIAEKYELDEDYVSNVLEDGMTRSFPITIGHTLAYPMPNYEQIINILVEQEDLMVKLASQGNCIFVGQSADSILREYKPFNVFVYADIPTKEKRIRARASEDEKLTDHELSKQIKKIDNSRAKRTELYSDKKWGQKERYDLCVNTSEMEVKDLAPVIAEYAKFWFNK